MIKSIEKRLLPMLLAILMVASALPLTAFAADTETITGVLGDSSSENISISSQRSGYMGSVTGVYSDDKTTYTATAIGGKSIFSSYAATNNITITNKSDKKAKIQFDYSVANAATFTIAGTSLTSTTGTYTSAEIDSGATIKVVLTSNKNATANLTLNNFYLLVSLQAFDVTVNFNAALGSVKVDNTAIESGSTQGVVASTGAVFTATPVSGARFLGWINTANNQILSQEASLTLNPEVAMSIEAFFVNNSSKPYFMVDTKYLFDDLNSAATSGSKVVLLNDATLPAGNYTIPSGVTLLIPFDDANTLYTTEPGIYPKENSFALTPTPYRTLKMANGANITVNGAISVSAQTNASGGNKVGAGAPVGPCGFINMNNGSTITVNSGASLYAWGFITGEGNITAKSNSKIYENFQMQDFRGGSAFSNLDNRVFTTSQYYVQNIEVALTLEAGATEYSFTAINASIINSVGSAIAFISDSDAMFNLTSGSVTKRYDGSTDRMIIEADGNMTISPVSLRISIYSLNSSDYVLPINNNFTVIVNSGTMNIKQDIALLPGAEIIIHKDAHCILGSGTKAYIYDVDEWGGYCGGSNKTFIPVQYAPGRKYTRTDADLKDALVQIDGCIDASAGEVYTTASGANVYSTASGKAIVKSGTDTVTYQAIQTSNKISSYPQIPITPAKLKNADGSYTETASATTATEYIYNSTHGKWDNNNHTVTDTDVTAPTCTEQGFTTYTCSCGYSYEADYVDATGHSHGDWIIDKKATHYEEGSKHRECSCGHTETVAIPVIVCDIDDDTNTNGSELSSLQKHMLSITNIPDDKIYMFDMNYDGEINILDLIRLKKFIAGKS